LSQPSFGQFFYNNDNPLAYGVFASRPQLYASRLSP